MNGEFSEISPFEIEADDFIEEPNTIETRRRITAMDGDEVRAACQVLAAMHPDEYLKAFLDSHLRMIRDLGVIEDVINSRKDYISEVKGEQ